MQERKTTGAVEAIIPTFHPDDKFYRLLDALRVQTVPVTHVWVVNTEDGGAGSGAEERLSHYDGWVSLKSIPREAYDHGVARNLGASFTSADYLLFMTQDAVPVGDRLVESLLAGFSNPCVAVVYARQLPAADAPLLERLAREFNYPAKPQTKSAGDLKRLGIKTYFCSNVCALYSERVFDELGRFPENMIFNEDMVFASKAVRAGYSVRYQSDAEVIHSHNYGVSKLFGRYFDLGVSQRQNRDVFGALPSVGEGGRLVRFVVGRLLSLGKWGEVFRFFAHSSVKYAAYLLGKHYNCLPLSVCRKMSSFPAYWQTGRNRSNG